MSRKFRARPLYCITLVRLITFKSETFARSERISSWTPSVKNAVSWFALKFSNGNTAMLFSGIDAGLASSEPVARFSGEDNDGERKTLKATPKTAIKRAPATKNFGIRSRGRKPPVVERLLVAIIVGVAGFPTLS